MGNRILKLLIFLFFLFPIVAEESSLDGWRKFSKSKSADNIIDFIRCSAYSELNLKSCDMKISDTPSFFGELGLFITIVNNGKVRGCFGAFRHKNTQLTNVLQEYVRGALRNDPRYPPLETEELKTAHFILTVADSPVPIADIETISLTRYGLYLTKENGQGFVYVPGEIRSHSSLKRIIKKEKIQDVSVFKAVLIK